MADPTPSIDETIAEIRAALADVKSADTRSWHIEKDALRDQQGRCVAWATGIRVGANAFRYIETVRPEVLEQLLDELERLKAQGRRPAKRAGSLPS